MIALTHEEIDVQSLLGQVSSTRAGAVLLFVGTTRRITGERMTDSLDYECYPEMAKKKLAELETEARRRWPLVASKKIQNVSRILFHNYHSLVGLGGRFCHKHSC